MWAYIYHFLRAYKKCFFPYSVSYTEVTAEWKIADIHLPLMHYLRLTTLTRWTWYLCLFWASWTNLVCSLWLSFVHFPFLFISSSFFPRFFPGWGLSRDLRGFSEFSDPVIKSQEGVRAVATATIYMPFFPFLSQGMRKMAVKVECRFDWMREREQKESGGHAFYGLPWTIPPFHFLELIIFQ